MSKRITFFGLGLAVAASSVALAAPAHAAVDPDDTAGTPTTSDIIGAGSDTSQHAVWLLAEAYNDQNPTNELFTYAATGGGTIPLPTAAINRPNGSGAGKALLYGAGNNTDIDFARSSSSLNTNETNANLFQFPFALDTLKMAVSGSSTNAPLDLTPDEIVDIYDGTVTNWSQLGGSNGVIVPMIPQSGSGTRSFFVAQLTAANQGNPVALANTVVEVQEHDPAPIAGNPNAVAPFSAGRAGLAGTALRLETGFSADRALYNVVRQAALSNTDIQALFGEDGFFCSDDATDLIVEAGFSQLARAEDGGVCGVATQVATSDFDINEPAEPIATTTTVAGTSTKARALTLTATVAGSSTPEGEVEFSITGTDTVLGTATTIGGVARLDLTGVAPGSYPVTASYTPAEDTDFVASEGTKTVTVKTSSSITEGFPAKTKKGASSVSGKVTVKLAGVSTKATGTVVIKEGAKTVGTGKLANGVATVKLTKKKVGAGKSTLVASWAGNGAAVGSTKKFTVTFK